jgi:Chaperone of endosialidase
LSRALFHPTVGPLLTNNGASIIQAKDFTNTNLVQLEASNVALSSDVDIKEDIEALDVSALEMIRNGKVYKYRFKDGKGERRLQYGVLLANEMPEVVKGADGKSVIGIPYDCVELARDSRAGRSSERT